MEVEAIDGLTVMPRDPRDELSVADAATGVEIDGELNFCLCNGQSDSTRLIMREDKI